ncbi:hypothetical protein F0562_001967 [Nyssa sinensis]|uniref:Uncharacterized protein n=1 Tax=Nyssa sinensis TaxID=561372 RepID=A0A5J5C4G2_9ASTE|nr:hypothetical protein F0562_001967 [Nyssa sinensis]
MYVVETDASEAEARHRSEIETTKVAAVNEQNDKILKLKRKVAFNGYNLCLKKMAKAFPELDMEVPPQHLIDPGSLVGLVAEEVAPTQEAHCRFGHSEIVDSELAEVLIGPKPAAVAASPKWAMEAAESVRLKFADFELNSSHLAQIFNLLSHGYDPRYALRGYSKMCSVLNPRRALLCSVLNPRFAQAVC